VSYIDTAQITTLQWGARVEDGSYLVIYPELGGRRAVLEANDLVRLRQIISNQSIKVPPWIGAFSGYAGTMHMGSYVVDE
jgi:hypothetical protein